jgi:Transglycosylase SLT domain
VRAGTVLVVGGVLALVIVAHDTQNPAPQAAGGAVAGGDLKPGSVPAAYAAIITDAATTCPPITAALLAAQINQESGFDPKAVSVTDAMGIAQFEPGTAASNHVNPWDPDSAIHGMARLDCSNYRRFGSVTLALAAYNGGPGIVGHWQDVAQTRNYVASILAAVPHYTNPDPTPATGPTPAPAPSGTATPPTALQVIEQWYNALRKAADKTGPSSGGGS